MTRTTHMYKVIHTTSVGRRVSGAKPTTERENIEEEIEKRKRYATQYEEEGEEEGDVVLLPRGLPPPNPPRPRPREPHKH